MGLNIVEMVMSIEQEFGVDLPDGALSRVTTVGSLHALLLERLQIPAGTPRAEAIWQKLQAIVVTDLGVPLESVTPNARLYEDLGAS